MGFKLGNERRQIRNSKNTPIFRKDLEDGVLGKANKDGSVYIDKSVKPGSPLEKKIIKHEGQHMKDMAEGKLSYGDDYVRYNGKTYLRKDGKIKHNGVWKQEGDDSFPWEKRANGR
tara:strand:+ start:270 stop:617 length:348 start_codon:yes stop_codon:yes gene_type:complete